VVDEVEHQFAVLGQGLLPGRLAIDLDHGCRRRIVGDSNHIAEEKKGLADPRVAFELDGRHLALGCRASGFDTQTDKIYVAQASLFEVTFTDLQLHWDRQIHPLARPLVGPALAGSVGALTAQSLQPTQQLGPVFVPLICHGQLQLEAESVPFFLATTKL
jgi:hypothetical protein